MLQFPLSFHDQQSQELTEQIISLATILQQIPIQPYSAEKIFHQQFLKSSLFSARIEGNTLTLIEAAQTNLGNSKKKSKKEINNILHVLQHLADFSQKLTEKDLLKIHQLALHDIHPDAGKFRYESSAIFDQFGNVVYLTPSPAEMKKMLHSVLEEYDRQQPLPFVFNHIANCHYYFEKIHPFLDGNGRVGRILLQLQLQKTNLFGKYILPIDQYFEEHRSDYYFYLEKNSRNTQEFTTFFLKGLNWSLHSILSDIKNISAESQTLAKENLLPRRQEILDILQDHPFISLETITRRFPTINKHTLAYDMKWLWKNGFVTKHGRTRGVCYSIK